jgi:hypothetical protein
MRFTLFLERDVELEARTDRDAAALAAAIDLAVDRAIDRHAAGDGDAAATEVIYRHSTCHRGRHNKRVYEHQEGEP